MSCPRIGVDQLPGLSVFGVRMDSMVATNTAQRKSSAENFTISSDSQWISDISSDFVRPTQHFVAVEEVSDGRVQN